MINRVREHYNNLSSREQKLVGLAAIVALFILLMYVVKQAPTLFQSSVRPQVEQQRAEFENLVPKLIKLNKLKKYKHDYQSFSETDLYEYINNNMPELKVFDKDELVLSKIDSKVQIKYKAVSFDDLIKWLETLNRKYGVSITYAKIDLAKDEKGKLKDGYVAVDIILM